MLRIVTHPDIKNTAIIDKEILDSVQSLMKGKFAKMMAFFLEDSSRYVCQIEEALAGNNINAVAMPAHSLKSSSNQMGALYLSTIARRIEDISRHPTDKNSALKKISDILPELKTALEETQSAYRSL